MTSAKARAPVGIARVRDGAVALTLSLIAFGAGWTSLRADDDPWSDRIDVGAIVESRYAVETDDGSTQVLEGVLTPDVRIDFPEGFQLTAIARLRGDAADKLEPGHPSQDTRSSLSRRWFIGDDVDAELRELFVDADLGPVALRLGKQQIVWGKADGLKVLDRVDPQSFREFILPPMEDSRIPLWSVNAEVPVGDAYLQLIWVPDRTYDDIPERDAAFAFTSPLLVPKPPAGVPVTVEDAERPDRPIADTDAGARLSGFFGGWEWSVNYLYHYADLPVFYQERTADGIRVRPKYRRTHLAGGSASTAVGDMVIRSEVAYQTDRYLTVDETDPDGVARSGEANWVLGLDWSGLTDTFVSGQVFQTVLTDHDRAMVQDEVETILTFLVQRTFLNETLTARLFHFQGVNEGDGLVRASVDYALRSNVDLSLGWDYFFGDNDGLFGQYDNRDRVVLGVRVGL